jgi:hypothetical protein
MSQLQASRSRNWRMIIAIIVAVALAVAVTVIALRDSDKPRDIGVGVIAEGPDLPSNLRAKAASDIALPALLLEEPFSMISPVFEITPAGELPGITRFTFPLSEPFVTDEATMLIPLTAASPEGPWTPVYAQDNRGMPVGPLLAEVPADGLTVTTATNHLSFFTVVKVNIGRAATLVRNTAGELVAGAKDIASQFGEAFHRGTNLFNQEFERPECSGESEVREDYTAEPYRSNKADAFAWCLGIQDGDAVLKTESNRPYPLLIRHTSRSTPIADVSPTRSYIAKLVEQLPRLAVMSAPDSEVTFKLNLLPGEPALFESEFDGLSQSLYALELMTATVLNWGVFRADIGKVSEMIESMLDITECTTAAFNDDAQDSLQRRITALVLACFKPEVFLKHLGPVALVLGALMPGVAVIEFLFSEIGALIDQIDGDNKYKLIVSRNDGRITPRTPSQEPEGPSSSCQSSDQLFCYDSIQGDFDGDGRIDSATWAFDPHSQQNVGTYNMYVYLSFATSETTAGQFFIVPEQEVSLDPRENESLLSWLGVSDINNDGHDELALIQPSIFGSNLHLFKQVHGEVRRVELIPDRLGRFSVGSPLGPISEYSAGFQCRSDGSILAWRVEMFNGYSSDYTLNEIVYRLDANNTLTEVSNDTSNHPDADRLPFTVAQQRADSGCAGFDKLPNG